MSGFVAAGRVLKLSGGLFTVRLDAGEDPLSGRRIECRARGSLRDRGGLLPGDRVEVCYGESSFVAGGEGFVPVSDASGVPDAAISSVLPRKNTLIRPPMANLDILFVIIAAARPDPSLPAVDRLLASAEYRSVEPVIVITKRDLSPSSAATLADIYTKAGYPYSFLKERGISHLDRIRRGQQKDRTRKTDDEDGRALRDRSRREPRTHSGHPGVFVYRF